MPLSLPCLPSWALAPDPVRPCALHRRAARQRPAASARAACGLPRWRGVAAGRPAPPCRLAAWPRAATVRPPAGARGRRTQLPVPASATCRSRFSSRDFEEWGTVNGREREGLGSEQAGGRGSLLWAVIRVPKLVVYGLDHLFGLNLSSGIYLMYILIVNIVCIYVLWMYILIHFQKIVGYSWEYPGIQLPPPMPHNTYLWFSWISLKSLSPLSSSGAIIVTRRRLLILAFVSLSAEQNCIQPFREKELHQTKKHTLI